MSRSSSFFAHESSCFVCGDSGFNADVTFDETSHCIDFPFSFSASLAGMPAKAHGGMISSVLQEAQEALCFHLGYAVVLDQVRFEFKKAIDIDVEIYVRADLSYIKNNHILFVKALIEDSNNLLYARSISIWNSISYENLQEPPFNYTSEKHTRVVSILQEKKQLSANFLKEKTKKL